MKKRRSRRMPAHHEITINCWTTGLPLCSQSQNKENHYTLTIYPDIIINKKPIRFLPTISKDHHIITIK